MKITQTRDIRAANRWEIMHQVLEHSPISRVEICRRTGLNKATVSTIVKEWIDKGLLAETELGKSGGGRKPILLQPLHRRGRGGFGNRHQPGAGHFDRPLRRAGAGPGAVPHLGGELPPGVPQGVPGLGQAPGGDAPLPLWAGGHWCGGPRGGGPLGDDSLYPPAGLAEHRPALAAGGALPRACLPGQRWQPGRPGPAKPGAGQPGPRGPGQRGAPPEPGGGQRGGLHLHRAYHQRGGVPGLSRLCQRHWPPHHQPGRACPVLLRQVRLLGAVLLQRLR